MELGAALEEAGVEAAEDEAGVLAPLEEDPGAEADEPPEETPPLPTQLESAKNEIVHQRRSQSLEVGVGELTSAVD